MRERYSVPLECKLPSRTKQSMKAECDINQIVANLRRTGLLSHVNTRAPMYADVSAIPDYLSALNIVNAAKASFDALPAKVRQRFANDPGQLIGFLQDPANRDEGVALGLLKEPVKAPSTGAGGECPPSNSSPT